MLAELLDRYKLRLYYLTGPQPSAAGEGAEQGAEKGVAMIVSEMRATRPTGTSTRLGAAVRTVLEDLSGSTPAAIVLLTDGINTEGPPLGDGAIEAARRGVPLYLVGLGDERPERDVKLSDLLVDDEVFVDDVVYFEAKLSATGYQGRQAQVVLRRQDPEHAAADAPVLARTTVTLGADGQSQPVRLAHRPAQEGQFTYVLEVEPMEGESQAENNHLERVVRVRRETIRVLMVWAEPTFEYRFLYNMLSRDKSIQLSVVLQNADRRHFEQDKLVLKDGFPATAEDLARYDVIILGDADREAMLPSMIEHLVNFVEQPKKGGSLVVVAGPKHMPLGWRGTPLERLLPIDLATARAPDPEQPLSEGFAVRPTELGLASPGMLLGDRPEESGEVWKRLPPLYWLLEAPELKRGARVLAEAVPPPAPGPPALPSPALPSRGRPLPVIVMQYVGAGKVLFHATDETYRWRSGLGEVYFTRYWVQTIRYLARSKLKQGDQSVAVQTDQRQYRGGDPVRLSVRFAEPTAGPGHGRRCERDAGPQGASDPAGPVASQPGRRRAVRDDARRPGRRRVSRLPGCSPCSPARPPEPPSRSRRLKKMSSCRWTPRRWGEPPSRPRASSTPSARPIASSTTCPRAIGPPSTSPSGGPSGTGPPCWRSSSASWPANGSCENWGGMV